SLKTLYRKRTVIWPFYFYTIIRTLSKNGKLKNEIIRKYDLKPSIISNSIKQHQNTGPFNHQDNLKSDEKELIKLRKEVQHLKMEHDVLKQILKLI
ncbi:transposase, partial [Staphylococcus aureus]|uniref:transposase n=1 Tax=Staphylococcus aureus TaxID=1280 RepID=UPI000AF2E998